LCCVASWPDSDRNQGCRAGRPNVVPPNSRIKDLLDAQACYVTAIATQGSAKVIEGLFSCVSPELRIPKDHPLRVIRRLTEEALAALSVRL